MMLATVGERTLALKGDCLDLATKMFKLDAQGLTLEKLACHMADREPLEMDPSTRLALRIVRKAAKIGYFYKDAEFRSAEQLASEAWDLIVQEGKPIAVNADRLIAMHLAIPAIERWHAMTIGTSSCGPRTDSLMRAGGMETTIDLIMGSATEERIEDQQVIRSDKMLINWSMGHIDSEIDKRVLMIRCLMHVAKYGYVAPKLGIIYLDRDTHNATMNCVDIGLLGSFFENVRKAVKDLKRV